MLNLTQVGVDIRFIYIFVSPCHASALQCRLECDSGYVAQQTPLITCVKGEYAKKVSFGQFERLLKSLKSLKVRNYSSSPFCDQEKLVANSDCSLL